MKKAPQLLNFLALMPLLLCACRDSGQTPVLGEASATPPAEKATTVAEFSLFFANADFDGLTIEKRSLHFAPHATLVEKAQTLWDELKKSQNNQHAALIPQELTPSSILSGQNGELILDMPQSTIDRMNLGPAWEQLLLLAVSNTMAVNLPGIRSVKFLAGGSDRFSFAGHYATMQPLRPLGHP